MTLLLIVAFGLATAGIFILLELSPFTFLEELGRHLKQPKTSIKSKIEAEKKQKPPKGLKLLFLEVQEILRLTGKSSTFATLCILAMILFVVGAMIALSMNNIYLVSVLAVGLSLLPFYYIKFTASKRKKQINGELETALSVITTSYMRNKNSITKAVEENLEYLNPPIYEVFANFLMRTKYVDANLKFSLEQMKLGLDNRVFHSWIDAVISCQDDHYLKSTLPPIVNKLSDMRIVSAELDTILFEPVKEYITMLILVVGSIPLMYFLNQSWYDILMYTDFGKIILTIVATVIFISIPAVIKHTRPIEYKR